MARRRKGLRNRAILETFLFNRDAADGGGESEGHDLDRERGAVMIRMGKGRRTGTFDERVGVPVGREICIGGSAALLMASDDGTVFWSMGCV